MTGRRADDLSIKVDGAHAAIGRVWAQTDPDGCLAEVVRILDISLRRLLTDEEIELISLEVRAA